MGAVDRTLLSSLGFAEADKKEPDHGLACRYLALHTCDALMTKLCAAELTQANRRLMPRWDHHRTAKLSDRDAADRDSLLAALLATPKPKQDYSGCWRTDEVAFNVGPLVVRAVGKTEVPLNKGHGQYRTTIGFLDVLIHAQLFYECSLITTGGPNDLADHGTRPWAEKRLKEVVRGHHETIDVGHQDGAIAIEVKIRPVPLADVIRQINLYRQYREVSAWALVAPWELNDGDLEALKAEQITYLRLGAKFEDFKRRHQDQPTTATPEI